MKAVLRAQDNPVPMPAFIGHHVNDETRVAFSPDGRILATGLQNNTPVLWDAATGKHLYSLKGHTDEVTSVAFSPDGRTLATGSWDKTAALWDLEDNVNEWSGISLDEKGEYSMIDLNTLRYKLLGLELIPTAPQPNQPARWSKYHPFHWLPQAEAGDSNAMLQIGIIYDRNNDLARALQWYQRAVKAGSAQAKEQQDLLLHWLEDEENWQAVPGPFRDAFCKAKAEPELPEKVGTQCGSR